MIKNNVKKVEIEYEDGTVAIFMDDGISHTQHQFYRKGDLVHTQGRISHEVRWIEDRSMWPKTEE